MIWYISFGIFLLYKYASQAHNIYKVIKSVYSSVEWFVQKTWYFIKGTPTHEYQPIFQGELETTTKQSRLGMLWKRTKRFFGFVDNNTLPNVYGYTTNVSNSGTGMAMGMGNSESQIENDLFNKRFNNLIRENAINESQLGNYTENTYKSSYLESTPEQCESIIVPNYLESSHIPNQNFFTNTRPQFSTQNQNSMYYSINLESQSPTKRI